MINYGKHYVDNKDLLSIKKVLNSNYLTTGPFVKTFEENLQKFFGAKFVLAVSNGSTALHLAGKALNWDKNTSVITTPITFVSTINSILLNKSNPVLTDIDAETFTIDPNLVEYEIKKLRKKGAKKISVIGVDYAGHPCDWISLRYLANKFNLNLVNDNCHALGANYQNTQTYAAKYADIVTQSFHPVKNITTGEGGAVITRNNELFKKIETYRSHCIVKNMKTRSEGRWKYDVLDLGYNYRINDIECALGSSQLKKIKKFLKKRRNIAEIYNKHLSNLNSCISPKIKKNLGIKHAFHLYPFQIDFKALKILKKDFFNFFYKNKINLQVHYVPIYKFSCFKNFNFFNSKKFTISENFYNKEVSLPIYYGLKNHQVLKTIKLIKKMVLK